jgi:hypothetical protein
MAQYQHLPIYRTAYQLLFGSRVIKNFSNDDRYSLGTKIRDEIIDMVVLIYRANSYKRQAQHFWLLQSLRSSLDVDVRSAIIKR